MIRVTNKTTYRGPGVYIGRTWTSRPSIFVNPHIEGTTKENIANYRTYFGKRYTEDEVFRAAVHKIAKQAHMGELILICWCDPLPCHGHIIRDFIQQYNKIRMMREVKL